VEVAGMDWQTEVFKRLTEMQKEFHDEEVGWTFNEVKKVRIVFGTQTIEDAYAEIRQKPVFGFRPHGTRAEARIRLPFPQDPAQLLPKEGISLFFEGRPFGDEGSWRIQFMDLDREEKKVDYWLDNR
jgi:hypothetical protein